MSERKCQAKDPNNCRYHTPIEHATIAYETAHEALQEFNFLGTSAQEKYGSFYAAKQHKEILEAELQYAQAVIDSYNIENIENSLQELQGTTARYGPKANELQERLRQAKKIAYENTPQKLQAKQKRFEEIKNQKNIPGDPSDWRTQYNTAISQLITEQGNIINSEGGQSWGSYKQDTNLLKTRHLNQCGTLQIDQIREDSKTINEFSSLNDESGTYQEYLVKAKATCNCGQLVDETIEVQGTIGGLLDRLLKK